MKNKSFILFLIFFCITGAGLYSNSGFQQKADQGLVKDFANGATEFWVYFTDQADLSFASTLKTKDEKAFFVFNKLNEIALTTQVNVISFLKTNNIEYTSFYVVNAIYVKAGIAVAAHLANFPEVKYLLHNQKFKYLKPVEESETDFGKQGDGLMAIEWGITKTNADKVWAMGFKGQGVVVGGQDTGYDWSHPAIKSQYRGWNGTTANHNYNWYDAIHSGGGGNCGVNSKQPCDDQSHGTHTMGTMVGDDGKGNQIGMAPMAKWIGCRNMNQGAGTLNSYVECFQWFLAPTDLNNQNPDPTKAPHVINNSWGCDGSEGCNTSNFSVMETALNNLRASGVVVVVSAGNSGPNCNTVSDPAAIFDKSFTVGSTKNDDTMSGFSSRGAVTIDGSNRLKPDISAPGSQIRSCVPGGGFQSMSGTSMAGPHVAGMVALLISAKPSLAGQVDSIEAIIQRTAKKINGNQTCNGTSSSVFPNNTVGHGRIDVLAAVNDALGITNVNYQSNSSGAFVYPNPANNTITFRTTNVSSNASVLKIYSITGQLVITVTSDFSSGTEVSVSKLENGMYFYLIESPQNKFTGKFIKE